MVCRRMSTFSCSASAAGVALRPHVEADDDGVRRRGQQHVGFVDGAHAGVHHADLDLVVGELLQRLGEHFGRSAHVGLEDDGQFLDLARLHLLVQLFERDAAGSWTWRRRAPWLRGKSTICLALAVSVTTWKSSPASGSESRPSTSTGVEGSASRICCAAIV